ncbi:hypothetical protein [Paraclostridium bifermentans]|uniref:hypothetical protein n=1 Tax=Paraclostridium bifermentans TaxID=1490 RepID=UPI00359C8D19
MDFIKKKDSISNLISVSDYASLLYTMKSTNAVTFLSKFDNKNLNLFDNFNIKYKCFDLDGLNMIFGWICRSNYTLTPVESDFINNLTSFFLD